MSILSQVGVVILIAAIIFILIRSNKTLEKASEEGEHFVDEWALRQQRKEERMLEKQRQKEDNLSEIQQNSEGRFSEIQQNNEGRFSEIQQNSEDRLEIQRKDREELPYWKRDVEMTEHRKDNIVLMDQYRSPGITLVQLNENHHPVRHVRVNRLPFTIGRSKENMLVLDDLCVAKNHCRIIEKDDKFVLEDVGSANKLFANGLVVEEVILSDRLQVYIGNVEFRVEMEMGRSKQTQLYQNTGEML